jgi:hypothetical protein
MRRSLPFVALTPALAQRERGRRQRESGKTPQRVEVTRRAMRDEAEIAPSPSGRGLG